MRAIGIHLAPLLDAERPRASALAELDSSGRLRDLRVLASDDDVLAGVGADTVVAVDAPLDVPNEAGSRDVERILAWCDVPLFPVAGARLDTIYGGRRGVGLAPRLRAAAARVVETAPELVLRQLIFEQTHGVDPPALDLAAYRQRWLGLRAPAYRPKGAGRAKPGGLAPAAELLAGVIDLGDWRPTPAGDDFAAIADAARLDAIASAYVVHRWLQNPERTVLLGAGGLGELLLPADANLRGRIRVNVERMRAAGELAPAVVLGVLEPPPDPDIDVAS